MAIFVLFSPTMKGPWEKKPLNIFHRLRRIVFSLSVVYYSVVSNVERCDKLVCLVWRFRFASSQNTCETKSNIFCVYITYHYHLIFSSTAHSVFKHNMWNITLVCRRSCTTSTQSVSWTEVCSRTTARRRKTTCSQWTWRVTWWSGVAGRCGPTGSDSQVHAAPFVLENTWFPLKQPQVFICNSHYMWYTKV